MFTATDFPKAKHCEKCDVGHKRSECEATNQKFASIFTTMTTKVHDVHYVRETNDRQEEFLIDTGATINVVQSERMIQNKTPSEVQV